MYIHSLYIACIYIVYSSKLCFIDPPDITGIEVTEVCTNDFTVSWIAASNEEGLSYGVTVSPSNINADPIMETSYNFTGLMPATSYIVSIFSRINYNTCVGIPNNTTITTLAAGGGLQSKLTLYCLFLCYLLE